MLVEGVWGTVSPVGMSAERLTTLLRPLMSGAADAAGLRVEPLSADARLWGRDVDDERYAVVATF